MFKVGVHYLHATARQPHHGTELSAGYDLHACFQHHDSIKIHNGHELREYKAYEHLGEKDGKQFVRLYPGEWSLIPTGLIFKLPQVIKISILPRSGLALKHGLTVLNTPGLIDPDYTHETFVMLKNTSGVPYNVVDGDRIAQAVFEPVTWVQFEPASLREVELYREEVDRNGGFGSTGR